MTRHSRWRTLTAWVHEDAPTAAKNGGLTGKARLVISQDPGVSGREAEY